MPELLAKEIAECRWLSVMDHAKRWNTEDTNPLGVSTEDKIGVFPCREMLIETPELIGRGPRKQHVARGNQAERVFTDRLV